MRFTRLELGNWKNFKRVDVALAERNFVLGPNAIGKSNLLDAFRFLRDLAVDGGGLAKAVRDRDGMLRLRSLHATSNTRVMLGVELRDSENNGWRYRLEIKPERGVETPPTVVSETADRLLANGMEERRLTRPDEADKGDRQRLRQTALEQISANAAFRELSEIFATVSYVHLVPQLLKEDASLRLAGPVPDPFGRDFLDRLRKTQRRTRDARLSRIATVLRAVVPQFESLEFNEDDPASPHVVARFRHWRDTPALQTERQFSDGTLRLIGLLWTLQEKGGPLLLEEPELSLHPGIVRHLAPFIWRAQRKSGGRQVMVSTHSDLMLSDPGIGPDEVLLVAPDPAGNGSMVIAGAARADVVRLMNAGLVASEVIMPMSAPEQAELFATLTP